MDSYSCTNFKVVTFSHTWDIKGLDLPKDWYKINELKSKEFAASEYSNTKFIIQLSVPRHGHKYFAINLKETESNYNSRKYTFDLSVSFEKNSYCKQNSDNERIIINFDELSKEPSKIYPDDTLKVLCRVSIALSEPVYINPVPKPKILHDFAGLLNSEEFADVTIVTGDGKKIPAHKNILSARSKVFAAMFKHPLEESQQNCVKICDFKYEVVLEMLRFIYTDFAPKLKDMAEELLSAADKYDLERLKAMCVNCLHENLCDETAAMTLKLAYLYQEEGLKSIAVQYIKDNSDCVFQTPNWKGLVKTDKILILESFCALKLDDE